MFDAHGHGLSEPCEEDQRFAVNAFSHLVDDAEQFLSEVLRPWHAQHCRTTPLFYGGVYMGALTVRHPWATPPGSNFSNFPHPACSVVRIWQHVCIIVRPCRGLSHCLCAVLRDRAGPSEFGVACRCLPGCFSMLHPAAKYRAVSRLVSQSPGLQLPVCSWKCVVVHRSGSQSHVLQMLHVVGAGRLPQPDGLVLSASAVGIVRTPLMRAQEPLAGILNSLVPSYKLVPALEPERLLSCSDLVRIPRPLPSSECWVTLLHLIYAVSDRQKKKIAPFLFGGTSAPPCVRRLGPLNGVG